MFIISFVWQFHLSVVTTHLMAAVSDNWNGEFQGWTLYSSACRCSSDIQAKVSDRGSFVTYIQKTSTADRCLPVKTQLPTLYWNSVPFSWTKRWKTQKSTNLSLVLLRHQAYAMLEQNVTDVCNVTFKKTLLKRSCLICDIRNFRRYIILHKCDPP